MASHLCLQPSYNPKFWQLKDVGKQIVSPASQYENGILLGDFNSELTEESMSTFCQVHNL